jgi:hypothetical protein
MALIAYWIVHPASGWPGSPSGAQIAAGNLSDDSAASRAGSESGFATSGTVIIDEATAITGLSASTAYKLAWTVYDDVAQTYATPVIGDITTASAATAELVVAGGSGTFSGAASSPAVASLATTGVSGAFSGAASGQSNATAAGATLTAQAALQAGAASGQGNATAAGATLTVQATLQAGAASGPADATASGAVLGVYVQWLPAGIDAGVYWRAAARLGMAVPAQPRPLRVRSPARPRRLDMRA